MRLGVLGGTFDPPHFGHLVLAEFAREQLQLHHISFIVAGDPWRKSGRDLASAFDRLAMVRLAIAGNAAFVLDEREVRREGPTYTVDTLREIRDSLTPADELFFILGEDALADLPYWHDPAGIAALARIAVAPREGVSRPEVPFSEDRLVRVEMPYIGISSTLIRDRARRGLSLRYLIPDAVEGYIRERNLYAAPAQPHMASGPPP
jgi:nicotinate-nucleotide adenylyltransferase